MSDILFRLDAIEMSLEELLSFVQQVHLSHSSLLESYTHLLNSHKELMDAVEQHINGD